MGMHCMKKLILAISLLAPAESYGQYPYYREPRYPKGAYQKHAPYFHRGPFYAPQFRPQYRVVPRNDRSPYYEHCYSTTYGYQCRRGD
jgi:hypothetical protein